MRDEPSAIHLQIRPESKPAPERFQMPYTSNILYHFVGRKDPTDHSTNYSTLCTVLAGGCVSYAPHDDPNGYGQISYSVDRSKSLFTQDLIVPTVTCYCEIPYKDLKIHMTKYGLFGIGFEKRFLIDQGAMPVFYLPYSRDDRIGQSIHGANRILDIERVYKSFAELEDRISDGKEETVRYLSSPGRSSEQAICDMASMFGKDFLAFVKIFDCTLRDDHPCNYYMEREWRRYQYLRFEPDQVRKVIVAPGFGDRTRAKFPQYADRVCEYNEV